MIASSSRVVTIVRALKGAENLSDEEDGFGDSGSATCDENRCLGISEVMRWRSVGFGGGARKAMEKSLALAGDDGVTMIAGSGLFSSTKGSVRSSGAGMRV